MIAKQHEYRSNSGKSTAESILVINGIDDFTIYSGGGSYSASNSPKFFADSIRAAMKAKENQ